MATTSSDTDAPEPVAGATGGDPAAHRTGARRPSKRVLALVTVPLTALVVLGYAGEALFPALVGGHDLTLILLTPSLRNFGLVTNQLDAWAYYGVGIPRVLISDPLYYLLGLWYGSAAISWMERRTRTWGSMLRQLEQGFARYRYLILFALPYNFTALFAGAARVPLPTVILVRAAGIGFRLYLVRRAGEALESPLGRLTDWIGEYRVPLLAATITLVAISILMELKRGETKVESLAHLDEEIDEIERADHPDAAGAADDGDTATPTDPGR